MWHQIVGWIGSLALSACGIPQVIKTYRTKKARDISWWFVFLWFIGEITMFSYVLVDDILLKITHFPLYINYLINIALVIYLIYAKNKYKE